MNQINKLKLMFNQRFVKKSQKFKIIIFLFIFFVFSIYSALLFYKYETIYKNFYDGITGELNIPKDENGKNYDDGILKLFVKYKNGTISGKITKEEYDSIISKYGYKKIERLIDITYIIYDSDFEKQYIENIIEKNKLKSSHFEFIQKNDDFGKELIYKSPYKDTYMHFPIIIFSKLNYNIQELFKFDKKNISLVENRYYVSNKYQYYGYTFNLSDNLSTDLNKYCGEKGELIKNSNEKKDFILFIGKTKIEDFYENIKNLYDVDINFCYLPKIKTEKYLTSPNLDLKLKFSEDYDEVIDKGDDIKVLSDFFDNSNGIFYYKSSEKKLIKIEDFSKILN